MKFQCVIYSFIIIWCFSQKSLASTAVEVYANFCAGCHGKQMDGGSASSLTDDIWAYGSSPAEISKSIKEGLVSEGMPAWGEALDDAQIDALVRLIKDAPLRASSDPKASTMANSKQSSASGHNFSLTKLASFENAPWSIAFMPDTSMLITERSGRLWRWLNGELLEIKNIPDVWAYGQGGLLDVQLHPQYEKNGWIYLSFSEGSLMSGGMTKIVRGKITDGSWGNEELIYSVDKDLYTNRRVHFGSRIVLLDGYIYFTVGDRGHREEAQDLSQPNGKIHRLHDDGRVPSDNPFVGNKKALDSIWSYGHRNPQGLVYDPKTGKLWSTEHGPRGGDELNLIEKGKNYGWPVITYGINYNGTPISFETHREGMEQPRHYWDPSIATGGIDIYYGEVFPDWRGKIMASGMATESLHLLSLEGHNVTNEKVILKNQGRVRDVAVSKDGQVYVLLNSRSQGAIYQLNPSQP